MKTGIFSLSPIPTIDIMTPISVEKKNKIKMKKRKKLKLNEEESDKNIKTEKKFYNKVSIFNKYNTNENNNNSQSKTKDIS